MSEQYENGRTYSGMTQDIERLIRALDSVDYGRIEWDSSVGDHIVIEVGTEPLGGEQSDE